VRLTVDGDFGTKTRDALNKVQDVTSGLTADGVYGPNTRKGILWEVDFFNDAMSGAECNRVRDSSLWPVSSPRATLRPDAGNPFDRLDLGLFPGEFGDVLSA
jgi:hypothetical protein